MTLNSNLIYMAPLEGITGYIFRNAYDKVFGDIDKYFAPFIASKATGAYKGRELRDILPENNKDIHLVPQILSKDSKDFINLAKIIMDMGYNEINLNAGCPSKTVTAKGKGAAMLWDTYFLEKFLDDIFSANLCNISIKTRIGCYEEDEFDKISKILLKYPFSEIIIHPRLMVDYYINKPRLQVFEKIYNKNNENLCYNADIYNKTDFDNIKAQFPFCKAFMLGRGILSNPALVYDIKNNDNTSLMADKIRQFHDVVYQGYKEYMSGDKNVLFKMKELWAYMQNCICEKQKDGFYKAVRKTVNCKEYETLINDVEFNVNIK